MLILDAASSSSGSKSASVCKSAAAHEPAAPRKIGADSWDDSNSRKALSTADSGRESEDVRRIQVAQAARRPYGTRIRGESSRGQGSYEKFETSHSSRFSSRSSTNQEDRQGEMLAKNDKAVQLVG